MFLTVFPFASFSLLAKSTSSKLFIDKLSPLNPVVLAFAILLVITSCLASSVTKPVTAVYKPLIISPHPLYQK
ncbi:hypothetical protein D3C76_1080350 [compost metagenome]